METTYPNPANSGTPENVPPQQQQQGQAQPDAPAISMEQLAETAKEVLGTMLPLLSFEAKLTSIIEPNQVRIRMECDDAGRLIGRRGTTVNEIQFLLNRILQRRHKAIPRIFLDVDGAGAKEEVEETQSEVIQRVKSVVDQVRRWGEAAETEPLSTLERKSVEDYYAKDKELEVITIQSKEDSGGMQRLRIKLKG
jgi:spoIIIJ-associated protein